MTKRRLTILLAIPLLPAAILATALYGALHTSTGARWIISGVQGQLPGSLEIAKTEGDLSSGLQLQNISYRDSGLSVMADRFRLSVSLDLFPPAIRVNSLSIRSLKVQVLPNEPGSTPPGDVLSSLALPLPLEMEDLLVDGFVYLNADGAAEFAAKRLAAAVFLHDKLQVEKLVLEMDKGRFQLDGRIELTAPFPVEMNLGARLLLALEENSAPTDFDIQAHVRGDLSRQLEIALSSQRPVATVSGTLHELLGEPHWQLDLKSPGLRWPLDSQQNADAGIESLSMHSEGRIESYSLSATGRVRLSGPDQYQLNMQARGKLNGMVIQTLGLTGPALQLSASSELNWQDGLSATVLSNLDYLDPATWFSDWPEGQPVQGVIGFSLAEQSLRISGLHLEAAESSITLDGSGNVDIEEGKLAAEMAWKGLAWPVGAAHPDIRSRAGRILLSGTLDDWHLAGDADLESAGLPPGTLRLEAAGNRDHARMTIVDSRILGGTVSGDAEYDWSENGRWSARLRAESIETQGLHSALPGMVIADLTALGTLEPFYLDLDIRTLEGEIRNQQVKAGGRVQIREESLEFTNLLVSSADSTLALHGNTSSAGGVEFSANIVDLGSVLAHSAGSIQADGRISLRVGKPRLLLNLEGREVAWEDIYLQRLSVQNSANPVSDAIADLHLEAENLQFGGHALDNISLGLDITESRQAIRLAAQRSGLELFATLNGSLRQSGSAFYDSEWMGQISSIAFGESGQAALNLIQPASFELSANRAAIKTACIGAGTESQLCLGAGWERDGAFFTTLKLTQISLDLIQSLLDTDLELTQYANGEFRWEATANKPPSGHAMIRLSPGEVRYAGDTDALFKTGEGLIGFELDEGRLSAGNFDVPLPGLGGIDLDFSVADVTSGLDADLDGRLRMELADLEILTMFLPMLDHAEGQFDADLALSGSAAHPYFSGSLSLLNGRINHEASGLSLSDIQLSGRVIGNNETQMNGSFRALEGSGSLQAVVDLSDILSPRVELSVEGKNLTLLDAPRLKVVAEPDIQLNWQDGIIEIDGSLLIPSAHIAPDVIPESMVSESLDLVIVAGEVPASLAEGEVKPDIAIRGNFEVILGDEVELDLSVAVAEVNGSVNFTWQDDLLPLANGNYSLVGQIQAFGQLLQITEGNIGFPGVPADNPHLNIRAERQIYGNSEIRRAGVFVTGTLNRPVVEPYTDPITNRDRAQTLLITGSDFNMETGVGAVNIGTYIAPRVFVSYGIGVFEDENVISIRYDLGRNWGIKATSGQRQTGLDISYTIER